jgi:hypothetical protein
VETIWFQGSIFSASKLTNSRGKNSQQGCGEFRMCPPISLDTSFMGVAEPSAVAFSLPWKHALKKSARCCLLATARHANSEAQDLYLRGTYTFQTGTAESSEKAIRFFQQALQKDPDFAPAYVGLANTYATWISKKETV